MSDTPSAPPAAPSRAPQGWTQGRIRRAKTFAVVFAALAVAACWVVSQPWFSASLAGPVQCGQRSTQAVEIGMPDGGTSAPMAASACQSGLESAKPAQAMDPDLAAAGFVSVVDPPAVPTLFGFPGTTAWLVIGCAGLAYGTWTRRGLLTGVSLLPVLYAHQHFGAHIASVTWGGIEVNLEPAVGWHENLLTLAGGIGAVAAFFIVRTNFAERARRFREAQAAGEVDLAPVTGFLEAAGQFIYRPAGMFPAKPTVATKEKANA